MHILYTNIISTPYIIHMYIYTSHCLNINIYEQFIYPL